MSEAIVPGIEFLVIRSSLKFNGSVTRNCLGKYLVIPHDISPSFSRVITSVNVCSRDDISLLHLYRVSKRDGKPGSPNLKQS